MKPIRMFNFVAFIYEYMNNKLNKNQVLSYLAGPLEFDFSITRPFLVNEQAGDL